MAFYVKSNLDNIIWDELNALEDEFETIWVQIKRDIIYLGCCSYRHPNTEIEKFYQYIDRILTKISKENNLVFCMEINLPNIGSPLPNTSDIGQQPTK